MPLFAGSEAVRSIAGSSRSHAGISARRGPVYPQLLNDWAFSTASRARSGIDIGIERR
ncbi:hypothetical protein BN11_810010 [Nostocoides australiense Ben110]|uniref:Uncharacterized protein n=1 Tax=Nostocoides australiense Ben110 TaxID=1193182 RepID=W6K2W7_9MICO|nr:hypothetical protein BN11_810010 [Tetrasphaera australiensis Ben110]